MFGFFLLVPRILCRYEAWNLESQRTLLGLNYDIEEVNSFFQASGSLSFENKCQWEFPLDFK